MTKHIIAPLHLDAASPTAPRAEMVSYDELNRLLYTATRQVKGMREHTAAQRAQLDALQLELKSILSIPNTLSYQLGKLLLDSLKSPKAFLALPSGLVRLRAEAKRRRQHRAPLTLNPEQ